MSLLLIVLLISCNLQKEEKLSNPLVLREGLLYSDSLSTKPFTGRHKSRMLDMKVEYEIIDGVHQGDFIIYYPNNNIQMIGKMKDNKNVGKWKYFFPDGTIQTLGYFGNDIPGGKWIWYSERGAVIEEGNFLNGIREGEWKNYDSVGKVEMVRLYHGGNLIDSTNVK